MTFGNDKTVDITFFDSKKWLHCRTKEKKFKMKSTFILLFTIFLMQNVHSTQMSLEEVNDTELVKLINQEQYVVVLFSKKKKFLSRILFYFLVMTFIIFFLTNSFKKVTTMEKVMIWKLN